MNLSIIPIDKRSIEPYFPLCHFNPWIFILVECIALTSSATFVSLSSTTIRILEVSSCASRLRMFRLCLLTVLRAVGADVPLMPSDIVCVKEQQTSHLSIIDQIGRQFHKIVVLSVKLERCHKM